MFIQCSYAVDVVVVVCLERADDGPVFADLYLGTVDLNWEDGFFNVGEVSILRCVDVVCVFLGGC